MIAELLQSLVGAGGPLRYSPEFQSIASNLGIVLDFIDGSPDLAHSEQIFFETSVSNGTVDPFAMTSSVIPTIHTISTIDAARTHSELVFPFIMSTSHTTATQTQSTQTIATRARIPSFTTAPAPTTPLATSPFGGPTFEPTHSTI